MSRAANFSLLLLLVASMFLVSSCGGGSTSSTPPSPNTPSAATIYNVSMFPTPNGGPSIGTVSVDAKGKVTVQFTGAPASTTFTLQFCPAPAQNYSCFSVATVTTDASGKANTSFQFPQSGSWAGDFQLAVNGTAQFTTDFPGNNTGTYMTTLQGQATANGKGTFLNGPVPPQAPLNSGTITFTNGNMQIQFTGGLPNTTYAGGECPLFFGSSCYTLYNSNQQSGFQSDANGNLTFSVLPDGVFGDIFSVDIQGNSDAGYIGGFKVP
jgi:hypothetical protein